MKKIGLWMAALVAVTVGGVYATFNYAGNFELSKTETRSVSLAGAVNSTPVGEYTVDTTTLTMVIDSAETLGYTGMDKHKALLQVSGYITIKFVPSENASPTIQAAGLETSFSFTTGDDISTWSYTPINPDDTLGTAFQFFTVNAMETTIYPANSTQANKWTYVAEASGVPAHFIYTIQAADIYNNDMNNTDNSKRVLVLSDDVILETKAEHDSFLAALGKNSLKITVKAVAPSA